MIALNVSRDETFTASGQARITLLPDRARDVWRVWRYVVNTNSASQTRCSVYRGSEQSGTEVDFTRTGNNDVSENLRGLIVEFGNPLLFVWTDGTSGARATVSVVGEILKR